jgi:hypothetical protein
MGPYLHAMVAELHVHAGGVEVVRSLVGVVIRFLHPLT